MIVFGPADPRPFCCLGLDCGAEQIPREEHDRAVHKIVTPNGIIASSALPGEN